MYNSITLAQYVRLLAAVDSRGGQVTIHGWKTRTTIRAVDAVHALSPFVSGFLYTHVDTEGTMNRPQP